MKFIKVKAQLRNLVFLCISALVTNTPAFCAELPPEESKGLETAFLPIYLGGGVSRTNPTSFSEDIYLSGSLGSNAYYRYFMHDKWLVGIYGGFKSLIRLDETALTFFTLTQESSRLFRIYHPAWLGVGFRSMYMVGVEKASLPYERSNDESAQVGVGVGVNLTLFYLASRNVLLHGEVSRWRGTAKNNLHVIEAGVGVSFSFLSE